MSAGLMVEPKRKGKPGRKPDPERAMQATLMVRGSKAWRAWVDALAEHATRSGSVSDLVDQALVEFARIKGFGEDPPKRQAPSEEAT
jgi:hypothetical protein